jgi:hypothetical protein
MIVALNRMSDLTKTAFCQSIIMTVKIISVPLPKTLKDMKKIPILAFTLLCLCFCSCSNSDSKRDVELKNDNTIKSHTDSIVEEYMGISISDSSTIFIPKVHLINNCISEELHQTIIPFLNNNYPPKEYMIIINFYTSDVRMMSISRLPFHKIRREKVQCILGCCNIDGYDILIYDKIGFSSIERKKLLAPTSQTIKMRIIDGVLSGTDGPSWVYVLNDSLQLTPYEKNENW